VLKDLAVILVVAVVDWVAFKYFLDSYNKCFCK
jgi:hypothetical protein